jgi:predicted outer membrane protein
VHRIVLTIGLAGALLGACRGDRAAEPPPEPPPAGPAQLTDAQVVHALLAATELGQAAANRGQFAAQHVDVETFAHVVQADHAALNEAFGELAAALNLQPADNEVSQELRQRANEAAASVTASAPEQFDRAYVQAELDFYLTLVDAFDNRLLPATRNAELREYMRAAKPTLEAHLQRAAQLRAELERPAAAATPPPAAQTRPPAPPPPDTAAPPPVRDTTAPPPPVRRDTIPVLL